MREHNALCFEHHLKYALSPKFMKHLPTETPAKQMYFQEHMRYIINLTYPPALPRILQDSPSEHMPQATQRVVKHNIHAVIIHQYMI